MDCRCSATAICWGVTKIEIYSKFAKPLIHIAGHSTQYNWTPHTDDLPQRWWWFILTEEANAHKLNKFGQTTWWKQMGRMWRFFFERIHSGEPSPCSSSSTLESSGPWPSSSNLVPIYEGRTQTKRKSHSFSLPLPLRSQQLLFAKLNFNMYYHESHFMSIFPGGTGGFFSSVLPTFLTHHSCPAQL